MTSLWDKQAPSRVKKASEAPQAPAKAPVKAKGTQATRKKSAAKKG
jgi:hypothetical protein